MKYRITATLGPASELAALWEKMVFRGVTGFRLNTSHLSLDQLDVWLSRLGSFLSGSHREPLKVVLDLQGSKWRLGKFEPFELHTGEPLELHKAASTRTPGVLPVPHADFFRAAQVSGSEIVLNDAKVRLIIETAENQLIRARVVQGGAIAPRKGITFASSDYRKERLNEKDQAIIERTRAIPWIEYAISYVKDAREMQRYRELLGQETYLAAKLERKQALLQAQEIAEYADELWLCRGDLGAELDLKTMAEAVASFNLQVKALNLPVLMAGQVLEHLTEQPTPTRSEVCYLYDSLVSGYAGFVLSDETAIGKYPLESCQTAALFRDPSSGV
jgi:pyruvate kinase